MALYTFAVIDSYPLPQYDDAASIRVIEAGDIAAVVEDVDVAEYEGERLERNLGDQQWLERSVRHHETVIEDLLDGRAVVPMRFGSIFSHEQGLEAMLVENASRFHELLEGVRGRREWGVRIRADRQALVRQLAPSATSAGSGSDYLRRRRDEIQADGEAGTVAAGIARSVHEQLGAAAERSAVLEPRQRDQQTLMVAAYLVPIDVQQQFLDRATELAATRDGI